MATPGRLPAPTTYEPQNPTLAGLLSNVVVSLYPSYLVTRASVALLDRSDPTTIRVDAVAGLGPSAIVAGTPLHIGATDFARARGAGRSLVCRPPRVRGERTVLDDILWEEGVRSSVATPLRRDGADFGMLTVSSGDPDAFGSDDLSLFDSLARIVESRLADRFAPEATTGADPGGGDLRLVREVVTSSTRAVVPANVSGRGGRVVRLPIEGPD
jgi:transcriptional regulator with GAF, ATPase, and Fis domain